MDGQFIGEIRMFGGTFAPRDWAFCDGQLLPIAQHQALFSILGTEYGGDGRTTFALPDLRGRVPRHSGNGDSGPGLRPVRLGERGGREEHELSVAEMPSHSHPHTHPYAHNATLNVEQRVGNERLPKGNLLAVSKEDSEMYHTPDSGRANATLSKESIKVISDETPAVEKNVGGGQSFPVLNPYLGINFIIALEGLFPPRS